MKIRGGLPDTLRAMRKNRKLTLKRVAEHTGLSLSFLSDIERGRTEPSIKTLRKLSAYYQCSIVLVVEG